MEKHAEAHWRFGTAGFRAKMGPEPSCLNPNSIAQIAYAIGQHLKPNSQIIIGYDARHHSSEFALLAAQVLSAQGHKSFLFQKYIPTPLCAFVITHLKADAGIMITASHNPAQDNGVKVYEASGAQIVAPDTHHIESLLEKAPLASQIAHSSQNIHTIPESIFEAYLEAIHTSPVPGSENLRIIYTPIHGVGAAYTPRALRRAGFSSVELVSEQSEPDGNFPTVQFPNPEEPGVLDLAIRLGKISGADLILANDPDADRLAVAIGNQILSGNEIGILLADYLMRYATPVQNPLMITTLVSSRMLSKMTKDRGIHYAESVTGFANIMQLVFKLAQEQKQKFVFGYEEALGYCIGNRVRDKDGISAAVVFAQLFAQLKHIQQSVFDRLEQLYAQYGLHRNLQWSIRSQSADIIEKANNLIGLVKQSSPAPCLILYTGEYDLRLIIRPSGTEPKIKFYAEVIGKPEQKSILDLFLSRLQQNIQEQL